MKWVNTGCGIGTVGGNSNKMIWQVTAVIFLIVGSFCWILFCRNGLKAGKERKKRREDPEMVQRSETVF